MCAYDLDHQNSVMGCSTNQRLFCLRYPVVLDSCALPILDENITNTCRHQIEDVERGAGSASRTPHMHCLHHRQILVSDKCHQNLFSDRTDGISIFWAFLKFEISCSISAVRLFVLEFVRDGVHFLFFFVYAEVHIVKLIWYITTVPFFTLFKKS